MREPGLRNVRMEQGMPKKEKPGPSYRGAIAELKNQGVYPEEF